MATLNGDIIYEIIGHINQRDRQTILPNLALVSRTCLDTTRPFLFANVKWPRSDKSNEEELMFFPKKLWPYFKIFHLDWPAEWFEGDPPLWGSKEGDTYTPRHLDKIEAALPLMPSLHTFHITCPFDPPLSLFRVLQECISIKELKITDTPVWDALEDIDGPTLFAAERIVFTPVGEGARMGEGPVDKRFHSFRSYVNVEYRKIYLAKHRIWSMNYSPPRRPFLLRCRAETVTYLQLSGENLSLDDFSKPRLSFPALETLILTGPCPIVSPGSTMTLPAVISLMPRLRDLRVLINNNFTEHPLSMAPLPLDAQLAVYQQLTSLAMSNQAQDIAAVLRYANGLERLAINATIYLPRRPIALRRHELDTVLNKIQEGGGGQRLKQFRIMSDDEFDPTFVAKLGEVCPSLEVVELELCGYGYFDDGTNLWDEFVDTFAHYHALKELRVGLRFLLCDHDSKPYCRPCISDRRRLCAMHFAEQLPKLRRIGLEYRTLGSKHEDRWMDFDIIRGSHGGISIHELPMTWYQFPEVWEYVPLKK